MPRASGDQVLGSIPVLRQQGFISRSSSIHQVVMILHGYEFGPAIGFCCHLQLCELQANIDEPPRYSTSPAFTASLRASMVSSISVSTCPGTP